MKHIVLTGGGTAGHVTPNIALIPKLQEKGFQDLRSWVIQFPISVPMKESKKN